MATIGNRKIELMADRGLDLQGVHNFRDCGGYAVPGGGRLRRGVLWRSGQHHEASDSDLGKIARLSLASVFDLRTTRERESHPCRRPDGFKAEVVFSEDRVRENAPHLGAARLLSERTARLTYEALLRTYAGIAFRPELQEMMRHYLSRLAEGRGPSLVNCMAGKDRTGITVAMLHLALGVHRDDVFADYLLTNSFGDPEARIAAGARAIHVIIGEVDEEALRVLMAVEPEYLQTALAAIDERYGTVDAYLEQAIGVDAQMRERLRGALVEG
jgi:protein tyrosine/serine phosphatase